MIISDETSADIVSGSLNVQSSEFAMILPSVVFEMSGQSGDPQTDIGSLGGGPINGPTDDETTDDETTDEDESEDNDEDESSEGEEAA